MLRAEVDAFWHAGVQAGAPRRRRVGISPQYRDEPYGGVVCDPDGNNIELVDHNR